MTLMPIKTSKKNENPFMEEEANPSSRNIRVLRTVGYGLLLLTILDWAVIAFPPRLMDPVWEFQTIGALVERLPVPLLGLAFIFYGELQQRSRWEKSFVKIISWFSFLLGVLFWLMLPLGIMNTTRLHEQTSNQLSAVFQQQMTQAQQLEEKLNQAESSDINRFLQERGLDQGELTPEDVRNQALAELNNAKSRGQTQLDAEKKKRLMALLENSVKWNLGAVIGGSCFLYLWRITRWARVKRRRR